jgi:endoglucanase
MTTIRSFGSHSLGAALAPILFAGAALTAGCIAPGAQPTTSGAAALKECGPEGMIDDFEDNNNQNTVIDNRGGYWYTYVDKVGSTVWPEAGEQGGTFTPSEGGYNSKFAGAVKGKIGTAAIVFGALGMNFIDPKGIYDASKYEGITFFAKRGANSTGKVRLKVPDATTDPEGKVCSECFNDFGVDLNLTEQWTRYTIPFRDMKQMEGWGAPRKAHIDPSKLFGLQWQTQVQGADYDFAVDNVAFICKG